MQIAPGLHRIGDDLVAAYLLVTDEGATLVDAALPRYRARLRTELDGLGMTERDIRGIVLTHGDSDHIGFAEALRAEHGTTILMHADDVDRAKGIEPGPRTATPSWRPLPALRFVAAAIRGGMRPRHVTEVTTVADGDELQLPGSPRIIAMPGHSPGSIAVHLPTVSALCVGDALTTRHVLTGVDGPQPAPFTDEPALAHASLDRLRDVDADWVLPGHGAPWGRGVPALLDALGSPA